MSYQVHNFQTGEVIEAPPINEMDAQIQINENNISNKINSTEKGAANGVASLDAGGKVPTEQLPSYVDDVVEYASRSAFPATGERGKIYVALDTNLTYRWSGTTYVEISAPASIIDDTTGTGVSDKTWSSNKLAGSFDDMEEIVAVPYEDLTYPVAVGTATIHNGQFYTCKTLISSSEAFNSAHWTGPTNVCAVKADISNPKFTGSISLDRTGTVGSNSIAVGKYVEASGKQTGAFGEYTVAHGNDSFATGNWATANGACSTAHGTHTSAGGDNSFAAGTYTDASCANQVAFGKYNQKDPEYSSASAVGRFVEIVGNGTATNSRKNIRALKWTGDEYLKGDLYVGCGDDSSGGSKVATVAEIPTVSVQDVQIDGTSILSDGVANIPLCSTSAPGVMQIYSSRGLSLNSSKLYITKATSSEIKAGTNLYKPITPGVQNEAVFYGLSKVAGVDLAEESVTLGTYPDSSKTAIQSMLGLVIATTAETQEIIDAWEVSV